MWDRFSYICRKSLAPNSDFSAQSIEKVENEDACQLYGYLPKQNELSAIVLERIKRLENLQDQNDVLKIYGYLNISGCLEEPLRFRRITAYLAYVTVVFMVVSVIYQLFVAPSFIEVFESFELTFSSHLKGFEETWNYLGYVFLLVLIFTSFIGIKIRRLYQFRLGVERGFVFKFLLFPSIKESYLRLIAIILFPIVKAENNETQLEGKIAKHLVEVEKSGLDIIRETQSLIRIEAKNLLIACERQVKLVSTVVALIVIIAVFFFLVSAYSPIFVLGEIV